MPNIGKCDPRRQLVWRESLPLSSSDTPSTWSPKTGLNSTVKIKTIHTVSPSSYISLLPLSLAGISKCGGSGLTQMDIYVTQRAVTRFNKNSRLARRGTI